MAAPVSYDELFAVSGKQDISGKWALVSGASAGIGKASACALAAEGCNIALVARRQAQLDELSGEIKKRFPKLEVVVVVGDVLADETYAALKSSGVLDKVDILVNNAGLAKGVDRIGSASIADWKQMMDVNCLGAFRMVNEVLPGMIARGGGHIVTLGSVAGLDCYEGGSVYCASKFAVHAFMKTLRYETYAKNIRCTVVAPGAVGAGTEFSEVRFSGDRDKAAAVYKGIEELKATDVAAQIVFAVCQPSHVNVDLVHVMPVIQGGVGSRMHRS